MTVLRPDTCAQLTRDHRAPGQVDAAFGVPMRWELGLMIDTFDFGRHCSPHTFGHSCGSACLVLADPDVRLARRGPLPWQYGAG
ncbi:hypothetical protein [Streptomyces sp. NBC_00859]|uniref:hypothetical protein n=1 Tax=Streptomyces sp. NBC_00859 TaxID=2903682 RepID=UPI0038646182|nr:hypothetical protein OG584_01660 [Streptomyces sp. NBC_00859]